VSDQHQDHLNALNAALPLREKLKQAHHHMQELFPFVSRVAVALYDDETGILKTFLHSGEAQDPFAHYQSSLQETPSLKKILEKGLPRVINNMVTYEHPEQKEHHRRLGRSGFAASYTMPIFNQGKFIGFIFFNSKQKEVFTEPVLKQMDIYGHMIALLVINEVMSVNTLSAAVKTTSSLTHFRDPETGSHLDRMSRYSRLIARALADRFVLSDDYIEHLFMFAPLHDLGKIAIPDSILLKAGRLNSDEMAIMKTHVVKGKAIVDNFLENFGLDHFEYVDVLRNIANYHHEALNGSGYPQGLKGEQIPLEARIIAVADVFDALTSVRPYKEAWSNEKALALLQEMAGDVLDPDCVKALMDNLDEVLCIQKQFQESL